MGGISRRRDGFQNSGDEDECRREYDFTLLHRLLQESEQYHSLGLAEVEREDDVEQESRPTTLLDSIDHEQGAGHRAAEGWHKEMQERQSRNKISSTDLRFLLRAPEARAG